MPKVFWYKNIDSWFIFPKWVFSKDPVARRWPHCLQHGAATALLVTETRQSTAKGSLIVKVSHQVKALLTKRASKWMTSIMLLQYGTCLMEQEDLELRSREEFNPFSLEKGLTQPPV